MIVFLEAQGTNVYNRCGNNNKDEDNSPKNLNDKNQQASSQKFRQLISSVEITIKMETIVRKTLMIKNQQASSQKFRQLISSVEITIKMETIVRKALMIKINKFRLRNLNRNLNN